MTVKTSVSLRDDHYAFAEELVRRGRFNSVSAVIQYGLEQMREEDRAAREEREAFVKMLKERAAGPFIPLSQFMSGLDEFLAEERRADGLDD
jgi:antitoxin ParD1/3/4